MSALTAFSAYSLSALIRTFSPFFSSQGLQVQRTLGVRLTPAPGHGDPGEELLGNLDKLRRRTGM